jgi:hypothetical protein
MSCLVSADIVARPWLVYAIEPRRYESTARLAGPLQTSRIRLSSAPSATTLRGMGRRNKRSLKRRPKHKRARSLKDRRMKAKANAAHKRGLNRAKKRRRNRGKKK